MLVRHFASTCLFTLAATTLHAQAPEQPRPPHAMQRTLAARPPYPWTKRPDEVLRNLQHAIRAMHLDERSRSYKDMLTQPRITRILDVTSERTESYYLLELSDSQGTLLGLAAVKKSGGLIGSWPSEGTPLKWRAPDLAYVGRELAARFGAHHSYYYHTLPTNIAGAYDPFVPLIAAISPQGRLYVDRSLNVYRETGIVAPRKSLGGAPALLEEDAPEGALFLVTKDGSFRTVELIGTIGDVDRK